MAGSNTQAIESYGSEMYSGDIYSGSYFEPDIMLPEQFNSKDEEGIGGGERKLMSAILSDGIEAFIEQANNYVKGLYSKFDAIDWVENRDLTYVFSFDNVCTSLGIDPEYLRHGLTRYVHSIKKAKRTNNLHQVTEWKKIRRPRTK